MIEPRSDATSGPLEPAKSIPSPPSPFPTALVNSATPRHESMLMRRDAILRPGFSRVARERSSAHQLCQTYHPLPSTPHAHCSPCPPRSTALRNTHSIQTARIHFPLPLGIDQDILIP
ncbi:hypothetical protein BD779DRAFT_1531400 [Infundibulicybe gibba]|nr:hypothetical protein BD779DRAFT_1531400 [Infundibulicybe gibba]